MFRRAIGSVVLLGLIGGAAFTMSPAVRARVQQQWGRVSGWSEEARRADPVGFAEYARGKLQRDLEVMQRTRRELAAEVGQLSRKLREQQALADQAQLLAERFRAEYQAASVGGGFPIEVRGAAYTEAQVRSQVSMLLAEAEGYRQSLDQLSALSQQAESQMEALAVRLNSTGSQLAGLAAKRELLRARQLTTEGEQLLAQVDELMTGNAQLIADNPVRTVRELVAAPVAKPGRPVSSGKVEAFLAERPRMGQSPAGEVAERAGVEPVPTAVVPVSHSQQSDPGQGESETENLPEPAKRQQEEQPKPIFQQS
jgi:hypothetical protein